MTVSNENGLDLLTISKAAALDDRLSYAARGLLVELMSRPTESRANADGLSREARTARGDARGEGRRAMRALFAELEQTGYIRRERRRVAGGEFCTVLTVTDLPGCSNRNAPVRPQQDRSGIVYVIGDGRNGIVKIGITQNLRSRLKGMQVSYPHQLRVLCSFQAGIGLEEYLHQRFDNLRTRGEWFDFGSSDAVALISQAAASFEPQG